jgi:hypothetical protein
LYKQQIYDIFIIEKESSKESCAWNQNMVRSVNGKKNIQMLSAEKKKQRVNIVLK